MAFDPQARAKAGKPAGKIPGKRSKFGNVPTVVDGRKYASKKEAKRASELRLLALAGQITELAEQREFCLQVNGLLICKYLADFTYIDKRTGLLVVEDVKSAFTRKDAVYKLKKKLMRACLNIEIQEIV